MPWTLWTVLGARVAWSPVSHFPTSSRVIVSMGILPSHDGTWVAKSRR
ncbi:MAG TPA: hypothetical protein VF317_10585 [Dermatophilaceae bacterium]